MSQARFTSMPDYSQLTGKGAFKGLRSILPKNSGRNVTGRITTRHQGARMKRYLREIDWKRDKRGMPATVVTMEYDPNRTTHVALVVYQDGERRYILAPEGLAVGQIVMASEMAPLTVGNALPIRAIPVGTSVHNIEIRPGRGGQLVRGAGGMAVVSGFEDKWALIKLPSGEMRRFYLESYATVGQLSNTEWKNINLGKAGRKRRMGIRPTVRGTAQNPRSHPHGGGEGRSGEGMHPKTPWGKSARGTITRNRTKYSNRMIITRRKQK